MASGFVDEGLACGGGGSCECGSAPREGREECINVGLVLVQIPECGLGGDEIYLCLGNNDISPFLQPLSESST